MSRGLPLFFPFDLKLDLNSFEKNCLFVHRGSYPPSFITTIHLITHQPGMSSNHNSTLRQRQNWYIHLCYTSSEYALCLKAIEAELFATSGQSEYPLYVKGLICRHQGRIAESLTYFQGAVCLAPHNLCNLKGVARSLFLLGKHNAALDVYNETIKLGFNDWEVWHNKGLCYLFLQDFDGAIESFERGNDIGRHDSTFLQLGKVYQLMDNYKAALKVYKEALEFSPQNSEILTTLGLMYLRLGENQKAFECLGNSLASDPRDPKTILAAGSIIQDNQDMDVALVKYRIAAVQTPNSAQLWNNIGMCFFGKSRFVAAVSCLKRALYLAPFEWIVSYNLGLVHLNKNQYASAFHFFSASINLKPDVAGTYMYLAITLARLDDFDNSCSAYEKSIDLNGKDITCRLNYAITLYNNEEVERSRIQFEAVTSLRGKEGEEEEEEEEFKAMLTGLELALAAN